MGSPPVLLLDDVFSELDPARSEALLACLPAGQAILTTAAELPSGGRGRGPVPGRGREAPVVSGSPVTDVAAQSPFAAASATPDQAE